MKEPWEVPPSQLVSYAETIPQHEHIIPEATGGSEAELYEHTLKARRAQTKPPIVRHFPIGSWGIDSTGELTQLREFEFSDPRLIFIEGFPKNQFVDLYAEWIQAGHEPPPMRALETEKGNIKIQEGHHRAAALKQVGRTKFLAWVSITQGIRGLTHEQVVRQALKAGKNVPTEVLVAYPYLHQHIT